MSNERAVIIKACRARKHKGSRDSTRDTLASMQANDALRIFSYHTGRYGALVLAIMSLVADCYEEMRPLSGLVYASTSMRTTGVVLITLLAIDENYVYLSKNIQIFRWSRLRVLLCGAALLTFTLLSTRQGMPSTRAYESTFLVLTLCLVLIPPLAVDPGPIIEDPQHGTKVRTADPSLIATFSVLAYVGARLIRTGLNMCQEALDQAAEATYAVTHTAQLSGGLCVACNGWAAASVAICGGALFFGGLGAVFVLNNQRRVPIDLIDNPVIRKDRVPTTFDEMEVTRQQDISQGTHADLLEQQRDLNSLVRMSLALQAAGLISSFMAMGDCVANTDSVYDHYECTVGGTPPCPDQLIEFRRAGLVQHSIGTNTLAFITMCILSLRIERDYAFLAGHTGVMMRSGALIACVLIAVLVVTRITIADWQTDGYIEISFVLIILGTALSSFPSRNSSAATLVYVGLLVDHVYYCIREQECRSFSYFTNASNAIMGTLFFLAICVDAIVRCIDLQRRPWLRYVRAAVGITSWIGLSIALLLALLVTAALAAYDGSNVDEVIVQIDVLFNMGLAEQQSILRFLEWHYAPLIAWASFRQSTVLQHQHEIDRYIASGKQGDAPWDSDLLLLRRKHINYFRGGSWVIGVGAAAALWFAYKAISATAETPTAYPMSQLLMMIVTVIPPWFLLSI